MEVEEAQAHFVASNSKSLAQAAVNPALVPLAGHDAAARGFEEPPVPMVGFVLLELTAGVGFILRLMVDHRWQGKGYGKAKATARRRCVRLSSACTGTRRWR